MKYTAKIIDREADKDILGKALALKLRPIDVLECSITGHSDPFDAILHSIESSIDTYCQAGINTETDEVDFIFGVAANPEDPTVGYPWLLANSNFRITADWLKQCKRDIFPIMSNTFPILKNFVHKDNKASIKWLSWLGFRFYNVPVTFDTKDPRPAPMLLFAKLGE